ncbi:MAG: DNA methyltransferase [Candidatus Paceibacterota bacterium]|jgi:adenine specific DNA methylase Mod
MPSLNWIGKDKIENHDKDVAFRLLKKNEKLSLGKSSENLIVEGDNLEALKALMPHYAGKVKCIYIDPPYNTGNEGWVYNDKVNSPKIKEWLGRAVGPEGEDLTRHDKWLCMMYPRLKLLRDLLRDDGVIFISIDDNEQHNLRFIMDELFGEENFVTNIIWQKSFSPINLRKNFSSNHDFIIVYARNRVNLNLNLLVRGKENNERYKNLDNDPRGAWTSSDLTVGPIIREKLYKVVSPSGKIFIPPSGRCWVVTKERFEEYQKEKRIWWGEKGDNMPRQKRFLSEVQQGIVPMTIWTHQEVGHNQEAKQEIKQILKQEVPFETPKPTRLLKRIFQLATKENDLVMDSFVGSGTTGQAVLELNKEDGGNRKFILVELEEKIARKITQERVRRVAEKIGGDFEYVALGDALFESSGAINPKVSFKDLASYIYFTETHTNINPKKIKGNFIGEYNGQEFYLLFKDKDKNIFNRSTLSKIGKSKLSKIVYADKCLLDQDILNKWGIIFKQIPYSVKTY